MISESPFPAASRPVTRPMVIRNSDFAYFAAYEHTWPPSEWPAHSKFDAEKPFFFNSLNMYAIARPTACVLAAACG